MRRFIIFLIVASMLLGLFIPALAAPNKTNGYEEAEETYGAVATAKVTKLKGNQNGLTITVTVNGHVVAETYELIKNNSAGEFAVGDYRVYVSTHGNDKIDQCFITYAPPPAVQLNEINGFSLEDASVKFYSGDTETDMKCFIVGNTYTVVITLEGFKTFRHQFVYTHPGMVIDISLEPDKKPEPGAYTFNDGKYWNEWTTVGFADDVGIFGDHKNEIQIAINEDGIKMTRIWVGDHNYNFTNVHPQHPYGPVRLYIGIENLGDTDYDKTVFGDRIGALTYKSEYPIIEWQVGGNNPLVEGEVPEGDQSYLATIGKSHIVLSKGPLDYTRPVDEQLADGYGIKVPMNSNTVVGSCNPKEGYRYLTIMGIPPGSAWGGDDWVQPAFISIIVQVGSGSGGTGPIGTTENIPKHVPEETEFQGLQFDEQGRLVPSAYHQVQTFETGKEPKKAIFVGLDGSDSNPGTFDKPLRTIARALAYAEPGTSILIKPGVYNNMRITAMNLHGTEDEPIWIGGIPGMERPVFDGHNAGATFIDCSYIVLHHLEVRNSMTDPYATGIHAYASNQAEWPNLTHHFVFRGLYVHDINYQQFKLSDVVDYWLFDCEISHDGNGQSALIDAVGGVGRGVIAYNYLHDAKAPAIQLKGNAFDTDVYGNMFRNTAVQTINVGQVTGLQYFRPDIYSVPPKTMYEARDIRIYSNIFFDVGSTVAFWSSTDSYFVNNTVINTMNQTFRLLPSGNEDILAYYGQSHNNTISNNIFYDSSFYFNVDSSPYGVQTLVVDNNFFHNTSNPGSVPGSGGIVNYRNNKGGDAQFVNLSSLMLKEGSPAATGGYTFEFAATDYYGRPFADNRSYGAVQYVEYQDDHPLPPHPGDGWTGERRPYSFSDIRYPAEERIIWSACSSDETFGRFGSLAHESAVYTDENGIEVYRTIVGNWDWQWDYSRLFFDKGLPTTKPIGGGQFSGAVTYKFPHPVTGWSFDPGEGSIFHQYRDSGDLLYVIPSTAPLDFTNYIDLSEATLTKPWGAADSRTYSASDGYYYITVAGASGADRTWIRNINFTLAIPSDGGSSKLPDDDEWTGGRKVMAFVDRLQQPNGSTPEAPLPLWDSTGVNKDAIAITDESTNVISYGTFENDEGIKVYRLTAGDFLQWPYIFYYNHISDQYDPDVWTIGGAYDSVIVYKMPYPITGYDVNMHLGSAMFVGLSREVPDLTSKEAFLSGMGRIDRIWTNYINMTVSNEVDPAHGYYYLTIFGPEVKDQSAYGYWHRIYVYAPDLDNP